MICFNCLTVLKNRTLFLKKISAVTDKSKVKECPGELIAQIVSQTCVALLDLNAIIKT
jgi:hypothetical protein